jgi:hypothetical protein
MAFNEENIIKNVSDTIGSFLKNQQKSLKENAIDANDFSFEDDPNDSGEMPTDQAVADSGEQFISRYKSPQIIQLDFGYKLALLQSSINKEGLEAAGLLEDYVSLVLTHYYPFIQLDNLKVLKGEVPVVVKGSTRQKFAGLSETLKDLKRRGSVPISWSNLKSENPEIQEHLNNWYMHSMQDAKKAKHLIDYDIEHRTVTSKGKSVIEFFVRILTGNLGQNTDEQFFINDSNPYKEMYKGVAWRAIYDFFRFAMVPIAKGLYGYGNTDAPSWLMNNIEDALLGNGKVRGVIPGLYSNEIKFNPDSGNAGAYIMTIAANNLKQLIAKSTKRQVDYSRLDDEIVKANANNTGIVVVSKLNPNEAVSNTNRTVKQIEGTPYWEYTYMPPESIKNDLDAVKKGSKKAGEKSPLALAKLLKAANLYKGMPYTEKLKNAEEYPDAITTEEPVEGFDMDVAKQLISSAITKMIPELNNLKAFRQHPKQMKNMLMWLFQLTGQQNVYAQTTYLKGENGQSVPHKEGDSVRYNANGTVKKDISGNVPITKKVWKTPMRQSNDNLKQKQYDRIIDGLQSAYGEDLPEFLKQPDRNKTYEQFDALLRKVRKYFGVVMADFSGEDTEKSDKVNWKDVKNRGTLDQLSAGVKSTPYDIGTPLFEELRNKIRSLIENSSRFHQPIKNNNTK